MIQSAVGKVEVLHCDEPKADGFSLIVRVLDGDVDAGVILEHQETAERWRVYSLGLMCSPEAYEAGKRLVLVNPLGAAKSPAPGTKLTILTAE